MDTRTRRARTRYYDPTQYMDSTPYQTPLGSMIRPVINITLTGTKQEVRADLERMHDEGRLASFTEPQEVITVDVEAYPVSNESYRERKLRHRDWLPIVVFVLGAAMITLAAVGVYLLVVAVISMVTMASMWLAAHAAQIVGTIVLLLALLIWLASKTGGCPGLHCGGCKG